MRIIERRGELLLKDRSEQIADPNLGNFLPRSYILIGLGYRGLFAWWHYWKQYRQQQPVRGVYQLSVVKDRAEESPTRPTVTPGWRGHTQSCAILRSNMRGLTPCREMDFSQMIQAIPQQINKQITITSPKVGGSDQNLDLHSELSKIPSF